MPASDPVRLDVINSRRTTRPQPIGRARPDRRGRVTAGTTAAAGHAVSVPKRPSREVPPVGDFDDQPLCSAGAERRNGTFALVCGGN
jgi:hypothetical protein